MKNFSNLQLLILGGAGLVFISNFLPWVTVEIAGKTLEEGSGNGWNRDGVIIFFLAGAAVAMTLIKQRGKEKVMAMIAMICAGLALLIGLYDLLKGLSDLSKINDLMALGGGKASIGIGLYLAVLACAALSVGCFLRWQSLPNPPAGSFPPPGSPPPPPSAPPPMPPQG